MGEEISSITFESLYDMVRKEKTTSELQKLHPDIYDQIIKYLKTKTETYRNAKDNQNFNSAELDKIKTQIINARKLVKEFYEKRESKLLHLAINKSRVKNVDETALMKEEKLLFDEATKMVDRYRDEILLNLINAKKPFSEHPITEQEKHIKKEEPKQETAQKPQESPDDKIKIRINSSIPKFVGTNLEIYGPFEDGDIAILPRELAEVIINRGRAEQINQSQS
jgi:DNA replication initiation complex subunit (GINS family)